MYQQNDKHQQALDKLNAKQQEAVTQIEGPVMVLAGPGTGKTEVLAVRIGQILKQQDVYPSNILCLTYSTAAVDAMRARLLSLIGPAANEISIYTYHSFCNKQINENASDTFNNRTLITDAQRHMLVEKMIYDHLSPRERKYLKPASSTRINDLIKIFSTLKQEGITKDQLVEIAEKCIVDDLPLEDKYQLKKGGLNVKGRELKERIEKFATEIAEMYADYADQLERRNKYEFEDMLIEGVLLLERDQALSTRLQEQYQYILVDEFQDTNLKQLALIDHLCSNVMEPNIFVVGDDDQCIYRFQGANKNNFTWIRNRFPRLQTIVLDINYRSTSQILQESFGLISKNSHRQPEKNQPLTAGNINYQLIAQKPVVRVYEDAEQEAYSVSKHIFDHSNGQYGGAAILARKHKEFDVIKYWLDFHKIPYTTNSNWINLLDTHFGKSFHYLLQFAKSYDANKYVADGFLLQFLLMKGLGSNLLKSFLLYKRERGISFFDWLSANRNRFNDLSNIIETIQGVLKYRNGHIVEECLSHCISMAEMGNDSSTLGQEKKSLQEFITSFIATDRDKTFVSLADMFWYHEQNGIAITVELTVNEDDESNSVFLSTIHGSKGLQYEKVYLIGCKNVNWEQRSNNEGIKVPDILNRYIVPECDSHDDMRRLLYVACTRAKTGLYVSAYRKTDSGKDLSMTSLFSDFLISENVDFVDVEDFSVPEKPSVLYTVNGDDELMGLIRERLAGFEISPTSTGTWEKCQNEFFYNALMKTTGTSAEAPSFGTLVHNVLQRVAENYIRQSDPYFIDSLVEEEMEKLKINFHSTRVGRYKEYGKWLIKDYLSVYPFTKKPEHIENEFHYALANGAKVKGKLDRVEVDANSVKVVDYKTGRYKSTLKEFESFEETGTQYWRQANIYSKLMHENFPGKSSYNFEFHYPEHESLITSFTYEANEAFEEWLGNIWDKSQTLTFESACKDPECVYCRNKVSG